jgi:hypothetical protein
MLELGDLLVQLVSLMPARVASSEAQLALQTTSLDLTVPIESRIVPGGDLQASLPRGLLRTGFDPPLGQVVARFEAISP